MIERQVCKECLQSTIIVVFDLKKSIREQEDKIADYNSNSYEKLTILK